MKEIKKTKSQYRGGIDFEFGTGKVYTSYPRLKNRIIKRFSVHQERSLTAMHKVEYKKEYNLKIRGSRDGSIPNPWDDYPSSVYELGKSWKHNSKRKKQYYREK